MRVARGERGLVWGGGRRRRVGHDSGEDGQGLVAHGKGKEEGLHRGIRESFFFWGGKM